MHPYTLIYCLISVWLSECIYTYDIQITSVENVVRVGPGSYSPLPALTVVLPAALETCASTPPTVVIRDNYLGAHPRLTQYPTVPRGDPQ